MRNSIDTKSLLLTNWLKPSAESGGLDLGRMDTRVAQIFEADRHQASMDPSVQSICISLLLTFVLCGAARSFSRG